MLTTRVSLTNDGTRRAGVERMIFWVIYETRDGKIVSEHGSLYDRADPQTARFVQWMRENTPRP